MEYLTLKVKIKNLETNYVFTMHAVMQICVVRHVCHSMLIIIVKEHRLVCVMCKSKIASSNLCESDDN